MAVSYATYERVALEDGDGIWELVCGRLREKPQMTQDHNILMRRLAAQLSRQLDEDVMQVSQNSPSLKISSGTYFVPDLCVIPAGLEAAGSRATSLEMYAQPLPLVAEVWSPSTGGYDVETKLPQYQERGDLEIWRLHPIDRDLTVWRRQPDGSYAESNHTAGIVEIASLPGVTIDLGRLFALTP